MVYGDHIAITSGNKSTTRREDFCRGCPLAPWIGVTHRECSDTYRRIGLDSEILPARLDVASPRGAENATRERRSLLTTDRNIPCWNRDIDRYLTFFAAIQRLKRPLTPRSSTGNAVREYGVTADGVVIRAANRVRL
jgi:hypothetical protein